MKRIRRNILVALTVFMMFASTGIGVFADDEVGASNDIETLNTEAVTESEPAEEPATDVTVTEPQTEATDEIIQEEPLQEESSDVQENQLRSINPNLKLTPIAGDGAVFLRWNGGKATTVAYKVFYSYEYLDEDTASPTYGQYIYSEPVCVNSTGTKTGKFVQTGLKNGTKFKFRIEAVNDPSDYDETTATPTASDLEPATLRVSSSYKIMVLEWEKVDGANAYIIQRRVNNGKWKDYITVSKYLDNDYYHTSGRNCTWENVYKLKDTKKYRYRIKAVALATENGDLIVKNSYYKVNNYKRYFIKEKAAYSKYYSSNSKQKKTIVKPMYIKLKPKMNRTLTSRDKYKGKHKSYTFKSSKTIKCYGFNDGCYYFKKKIGKHNYTFRIARINARSQKAYYVGDHNHQTKGNYTKREAELFVNKYMKDNKQSSNGAGKNYCIWVSYYTQHMFILKKNSKGKWEMATSLNDSKFPRDSWECSSGKASTPSYTGNNRINSNRAPSMRGIPWWNGYHGKKDKEGNFNGIHGKASSYVLGEPHSHACIRNDNKNAKLIYDAKIIGAMVICY